MRPLLRHFVVAGVLGLAGIVLSLGLIDTATAQGALNPLNALIVNTASRPVPVSLTGPVNVASTESFQMGLGNGNAYTVPADKQAVIKFVSGRCLYPTTSTEDGVRLQVDNPFVSVALAGNSFRTATILGTPLNVVGFTHQVLISAGPASEIEFESPSGSVCIGFISGDLIAAN